ncbi:DNA-binding transcriptional regulator, HxlR family [Pseudarcicella hirudinis]|uniref:DNA-binding transcriptional regulator, HxlR family n=1 Tax=Pseudarcicella hirudinis TaxID=1079859 RepID=A0A1I5MBX1_9BACT|nr:helix-turn-helix domain-containing protein [Pseudarcicella hirudinis]SFP06456.1 DNA-binding transcriptional regulator, HxlR family [Pseudarcicella hirudinis]
MEEKQVEKNHADCGAHLMAIRDALDILNGKWKIAIIGSLSFRKMRFMDLMREVEGITAKMLSKELKDLEVNELVKRTVYDTKPVTVEYELTTYGKSLEKVINELADWGTQHRKRIMSADKKTLEEFAG